MARDDSRKRGKTLDMVDAPLPSNADGGDDAVRQAVAISYDRAEDEAPIIVASGKGAYAEQILNLAFAHGIKVRKDSDLIEVLSKLEVDSAIPIEAFTAVAEILSYVYQANAVHGNNNKGLDPDKK